MRSKLALLKKAVLNPGLVYKQITRLLIDKTRWFPSWYNRRYVGSAAGDLVLDFGCNWGRQARIQRCLDRDAVGIDIQRSDRWRNTDAEFIVADGRSVPAKDGTFDMVVSVLSLTYIDDDERAISEIRRVLKEDGMLAISVANDENLYSTVTGKMLSESHERQYSREGIVELLERHGFAIDDLWTEKFYSPYFHSAVNSNLPNTVLNLLGLLLPPKRRGIIYVRARKV